MYCTLAYPCYCIRLPLNCERIVDEDFPPSARLLRRENSISSGVVRLKFRVRIIRIAVFLLGAGVRVLSGCRRACVNIKLTTWPARPVRLFPDASHSIPSTSVAFFNNHFAPDLHSSVRVRVSVLEIVFRVSLQLMRIIDGIHLRRINNYNGCQTIENCSTPNDDYSKSCSYTIISTIDAIFQSRNPLA